MTLGYFRLVAPALSTLALLPSFLSAVIFLSSSTKPTSQKHTPAMGPPKRLHMTLRGAILRQYYDHDLIPAARQRNQYYTFVNSTKPNYVNPVVFVPPPPHHCENPSFFQQKGSRHSPDRGGQKRDSSTREKLTTLILRSPPRSGNDSMQRNRSPKPHTKAPPSRWKATCEQNTPPQHDPPPTHPSLQPVVTKRSLITI